MAALPLVIAACSTFGVTSPDPGSPLDADASSDADTPSSDGGSDTEERDPLADADISGDASSCAVIRDDFEGKDWKAEPTWLVEQADGGVTWGPSTHRRAGSTGSQSLTFEGSSGAFARLGRTIEEQRCDLRFSAWLFVVESTGLNSRILAVETATGPRWPWRYARRTSRSSRTEP